MEKGYRLLFFKIEFCCIFTIKMKFLENQIKNVYLNWKAVGWRLSSRLTGKKNKQMYVRSGNFLKKKMFLEHFQLKIISL